MVQIVYLCAGLANRMFQYAFYLSLKSKGYITKIADNSIVKELKHEDVLITDIFPNVHYEKASILQIFFMGGGNDVFSRVIRNRLKIHSPFYERTSAQDGFKKELFENLSTIFSLLTGIITLSTLFIKGSVINPLLIIIGSIYFLIFIILFLTLYFEKNSLFKMN